MIGWRRAPLATDSREVVAVALAQELRQQARAELNRADSNAGTLLAAVLVAAGLALGHGLPAKLPLAAEAAGALAVASVAAGVALLCACIYPAGTRRRDRAHRHLVGYHGHVAAHGQSELERALLDQAGRPALGRLVHDLDALGKIADRKYRRLRRAIWCFAAGVALLVVAGALAVWS